MYNAKSVDSSIPCDNLFKDLECLLFWDASARLDDLAEIATIAKLGDYAGVGLSGDDLMHFDDVLQIAEKT